jgi:hypothetical protein
MAVMGFILLVLAWSHVSDHALAPCREGSPLACLEAQRLTPGPLVTTEPPAGLTADELRRLAEWGRLAAELKPWEAETVAAGRRAIPDPLP